MIQVKVMKNGKVINGVAFKDETDTIRKSLVSARNEMLKQGIEFDDLQAEFLGVNLNMEMLERLFIAPTDPEVAALEKHFEAKAHNPRS